MDANELNRHWYTIVNSMQEGVMIVDPKGIVISVNSAFEKITGYNYDECIGRHCSMLYYSICATVKDNKNRLRCTLLRKQGDYIHVLKNSAVIRNNRGSVIGALETLTDITEVVEKDNQIEAFRKEFSSEDRLNKMIGVSGTMKKVFELIVNAAQSDAPVIIFGESGTGKEMAAEAVHETGPRKDKPFVKVNCAALTESLLESELFGHVKGAFSGAYKDRQGRFEAAHGGDIFLDEIGDIPLSTQVKLLRVIEEKVIERVGDNRPIPVDVRIITATNRDLTKLVDNGAFRQDLFFRINVIPVNMPSLRDRTMDIPAIADAFFKRLVLKTGKDIKGISNQAMERLMSYKWPGNVRELKSAFEYAFVTCQKGLIEACHFPPNIYHDAGRSQKSFMSSDNVDSIKKERLMEALLQSGGNRSEAARILGISRVTVWKHIKKFGIDMKRREEKGLADRRVEITDNTRNISKLLS